jgi:hypothetical protein
MFCDIHGHAKKFNSFIYGCNTAANGGFCSWTKVRLFPRVYAKVSPFFSYQECRFRVEPEKVGYYFLIAKLATGRIVVWD